jgi:hypothetical protein
MRPHGSDLLEADRLKAGGIRPGTWALKAAVVRVLNERRTPMMWGLLSTRTAIVAVATIVFVASCILPLVSMLGLSLAGSGVTSSSYSALVLDARQRSLLYNTALLGVSTAVLATLIGVPLGVALARIDLPWKPTLRVLLAAPMLLPPYVAALAWVSLGGGTGLLAEYLGRDLLSAWTFSLPGAVLVLALVFYPLSISGIALDHWARCTARMRCCCSDTWRDFSRSQLWGWPPPCSRCPARMRKRRRRQVPVGHAR